MGEQANKWMEQALRCAQKAQGRTSPNPPVGAVVVRDERVIGRGWTQPPGGPHAEVVALAAAESEARGADLYVTLEPCTFWGRTPPCTDAIVDAGIRRVFFAAHAPDRRMGVGAVAVLAQAGIEAVQLPHYANEAEEQIAAFRCWTLHHRPLVIAKYAMTLDGKIATRTGDSRWISGPAARQQVHELRDQVDAIMVGVGTVLADNPVLTTRLDNHWRTVQHPLRIVVDSHGRTPLAARVFDSALPHTTLIATVDAPQEWRDAVTSRGIEVVTVPADGQGRVDLRALLQLLAQRKVTSLLVEGGSGLLGALAETQLIDRIWAFVAPKLVGGRTAPGPIGEPGVTFMREAATWRWVRHEQVGEDMLLVAAPRNDEVS